MNDHTSSAKPERIAKVIARSGVCSRREAERLIEQGLVTVNGTTIDSPALNVTDQDIVTVKGKPIGEKEATRLWLYHKPKGLITSHGDPQGRPTVFENLPKNLPRVISVGRLDFNTEGLLLLTNNGELSRHLESPKTGWKRKYRVRVFGDVKRADFDLLKKGLKWQTEDGEWMQYAPIHTTVTHDREGKNTWLEMIATEGKYREIRFACEAVGLTVNRLIRIQYGPFLLNKLPSERVKEIAQNELSQYLPKEYL